MKVDTCRQRHKKRSQGDVTVVAVKTALTVRCPPALKIDVVYYKNIRNSGKCGNTSDYLGLNIGTALNLKMTHRILQGAIPLLTTAYTF